MWVRWRSRYPTGWGSPLLGLLLILLLLPALDPPSPPDPPHPPNVAPWVWEQTTGGGEADFLVVLREQADLTPAVRLRDRRERAARVVRTLRETARRTQAGLRAVLDARGVDYRPFYVVNAVAVRGDRGLVAELAARPEVARVVGDPWVRVPLPAPERDVAPEAPSAVEWNVAQVNADDVWALGYTGEGVVVAGQDTGYQWDHPALIDAYRGWDGITVTHDYNWHDAIHEDNPNTATGNPCGFDSPEPCDDSGHGTHTMGTMVGSGGIGVAPGARWIGCRNMEEGWGKPSTYIECFEFFLAPYPVGGDPSQGDPSLAPHVINNSWYCPGYEGCDWWTLQEVVETVRAAGILVVVSAGNNGPGCSTVRYPPALYGAAFSVGATDGADRIASFSSRGPVTVDGSNRRKPDIAAPGVSVRSSVPGGYGTMSGTSMAGPHVAGVAALLWSAAPSLIGDVDGTERALEQSARPRTSGQGCGGDGPEEVPNNVYGWGVVDALAAVAGVRAGQEAHPEAVWPGAALTWTLYVTNTGYITLTATVTDVLPAHTLPSGVLTWTVPLFAPDEVWSATVPITVEEGYTGPLTNTLIVRSAEGTEDLDRAVAYVLPHLLFLPMVSRR
ncbi:MAG TPA: peptidase S8 [Chloroflexi bacterium]|nr:peptidase S8 [Chloroflexota bacterium]